LTIAFPQRYDIIRLSNKGGIKTMCRIDYDKEKTCVGFCELKACVCYVECIWNHKKYELKPIDKSREKDYN
jgi:hypothetical protein